MTDSTSFEQPKVFQVAIPFETIMTMVGLEDLDDLMSCQEVCESWMNAIVRYTDLTRNNHLIREICCAQRDSDAK